MALIKCPQCDTWTLPLPADAWCQVHGPIPLPPVKADA